MITTRLKGSSGESLSEEKLASGHLYIHVQLHLHCTCELMYMALQTDPAQGTCITLSSEPSRTTYYTFGGYIYINHSYPKYCNLIGH